ncbi:MAG: hypothetical protein K9N09_03145 [Candidatus Cloacimonetes bacterium]|nr:hypothetical protein [Candidatus Cloacimonadota bacterium]MCF7814536.1 hypothetical protein [Candidatus Cloacimonadota bacterium]MCF7867672.1 hypothetical protein [Candidatus Cloacimonadota bacterium]MCF7883530.1 hypothetical protein [Candidatus Cloacimonadota bacterium]
MDLKQIFNSAHEKIITNASVKFVFGDLIETKGKSIIPVSTIKYSIGGGEGKGPDLAKMKAVTGENAEEKPQENRPGGQGLGGRFSNNPLGVFEISEEKTRFVPVIPIKAIIVMITVWIVTRVFKRKKK